MTNVELGDRIRELSVMQRARFMGWLLGDASEEVRQAIEKALVYAESCPVEGGPPPERPHRQLGRIAREGRAERGSLLDEITEGGLAFERGYEGDL